MAALHLPTTVAAPTFSQHKPTNYNPLFVHPHPCSSPTRIPRLKFQNLPLLLPRAASGVAGTSPQAEDTAALPEGLQPELMPQHVAVIMDGNSRWAKQRGLPGSVGHLAGIRKLLRVADICCNWGISVLTVFGFSNDNWVRPKAETDFIMSLFGNGLKSEMDNFVREGIRVSIIGDLSKLPPSIQKWIVEAESKTKANTKLHLIVAVSYSGKNDITKACKSIAQKVKDGLIDIEDVNEELIERELETKCTQFPHPDLLIRTSGELRISNFLLWQLAYTELFFSRALWPDFGEEDFAEALRSYQQRNRRFGGQVKVTNDAQNL